ncbi:uncharacterized protein [Phaseolus vulgaris]|uniref:uncharacterized protein n=1 Tax=Phaseolus vulgaris TaxID=3885 RepID=UPI0035CBB9B1
MEQRQLGWELKWRREWFKWEKAQVDEFMTVLEGQTLKKGKEDKWLWRDPQTCKYSVKSAYAFVSNSIPSASKDMYRVMWGLLVPPSAQYFVWRALQNRITKKQNLIRRNTLNNFIALGLAKMAISSGNECGYPSSGVFGNIGMRLCLTKQKWMRVKSLP